MQSLDLMVEHDVYRMHGDGWHSREVYKSVAGDYISTRLAWDELSGIHGWIARKGEIFLITHKPAVHGMGGMSEGSPEEVVVYRLPTVVPHA